MFCAENQDISERWQAWVNTYEADTASAITACSPTPTAPPISPRRASCSPCRRSPTTPRPPSPQTPISPAHYRVLAPAAALACSSSRPSQLAASPDTGPAPPCRWSGSTHHDHARTTPTQHHAYLLQARGRPRRRLPKCCKSTPIMHETLAAEPRLRIRERLSPSSRHRSTTTLLATRAISPTLCRHQIAIEPAAPPAALPSATSCIVALPTPADAACGNGRERPASANLHNTHCQCRRTSIPAPCHQQTCTDTAPCQKVCCAGPPFWLHSRLQEGRPSSRVEE
jgi:hypothetical protein